MVSITHENGDVYCSSKPKCSICLLVKWADTTCCLCMEVYWPDGKCDLFPPILFPIWLLWKSKITHWVNVGQRLKMSVQYWKILLRLLCLSSPNLLSAKFLFVVRSSSLLRLSCSPLLHFGSLARLPTNSILVLRLDKTPESLLWCDTVCMNLLRNRLKLILFDLFFLISDLIYDPQHQGGENCLYFVSFETKHLQIVMLKHTFRSQ